MRPPGASRREAPVCYVGSPDQWTVIVTETTSDAGPSPAKRTPPGHQTPRRPVGRPPGDGAQTRQAILDAAAELLSRRGYAAMTLDDVAAMSRVTRPAIYNYFPSKRALAQEVLRGSGDSILEVWQAAAAAQPTLPDKLRAILHASLETAFDDPSTTLGFVGLARAARTDAEMAGLFRERSTVLRNYIRALAAEAARSGEDATVDPAGLVEAMSGLVWAISAGAAEAPDERIRDQIARGIDYLFRGSPGSAA
jgi:AcrR family transcriptional regulator